MTSYGEMAALMGFATGDAQAAIEATSNMAISDGQAGGSHDGSIIQVPANLDREKLEALGVVIIDELPQSIREREQSFVRIQIPDGWSLTKGSSIGLQDIVDERGVKRITTTDNGQWWDRYVATTVVSQGYEVPLRLVYGDGNLDSVLWDRLTDEEKEEAKQGLLRYVNPEDFRYAGESSVKAQEWLDIIETLP